MISPFPRSPSFFGDKPAREGQNDIDLLCYVSAAKVGTPLTAMYSVKHPTELTLVSGLLDLDIQATCQRRE